MYAMKIIPIWNEHIIYLLYFFPVFCSTLQMKKAAEQNYKLFQKDILLWQLDF